MTNKIAVVGAGNAGCISALNLYFHREDDEDCREKIGEIELYHDPSVNIERVGQGTQLSLRSLLFDSLSLNWKTNNKIKATFKTGINYEGWGQKNHDFFHHFGGGEPGCHYIPNLFSQATLESGLFKVIEKSISSPEKEIDADYIIDCRGKPNNMHGYRELTNPLNSVILARKEGRDVDLHYTRHVTTPNGWTFVIPNHDSVSYGYLYNNTITTKEEAEKDFIERFDVEPDGDLTFNNYVRERVWSSDRMIVNGNRFSFIEPLEATASYLHEEISTEFCDFLIGEQTRDGMNSFLQKSVTEVEDFILWHYMKGSKFDTPFWQYAQGLQLRDEEALQNYLKLSREVDTLEDDEDSDWACWGTHSFLNWYNNVCD